MEAGLADFLRIFPRSSMVIYEANCLTYITIVKYIYMYICIYVSKPFALPGQEHGHLLPLERRFPLGHASVPLLEYALMALLSTLVIIFKVLYFPGTSPMEIKGNSQVFSRYVQPVKE